MTCELVTVGEIAERLAFTSGAVKGWIRPRPGREFFPPFPPPLVASRPRRYDWALVCAWYERHADRHEFVCSRRGIRSDRW